MPLPARAPASSPEHGAGAPSLDDAFRAHARFVAGLGARILGRDADVDDVVQDVFLAASTRLGHLREPAALRGWLATITVRVARRRLRRRRLLTWLSLDDASPADVATTASAEDAVLVARIYEVLDTLPTDDRIAWCLRHFQGDDLQAVADAAGCSLATAKRRIARAHTAVRRALGDAGE